MINNRESDSDTVTSFNRDTLRHGYNINQFKVSTANRVITFSTRELVSFIRNPGRGTITFVVRKADNPLFFTFKTANTELRSDTHDPHPLVVESDKIIRNGKS